MTFGEKLQKLRARAGMSQDALAERLNVSRQAVSRWERDETMPETDKIVPLADLFGVTTDYLLREQPRGSAKEEKAAEQDWTDKLTYLAKTKGYLLGWLLTDHGTDGIVCLNIPRLGLGYEAAGDNHLVRHLVIRYALGLHHLLRRLGYLTVIQQVFKGFPHRPLPTPLLCPRLASF